LDVLLCGQQRALELPHPMGSCEPRREEPACEALDPPHVAVG
jgi:hypothetical protein